MQEIIKVQVIPNRASLYMKKYLLIVIVAFLSGACTEKHQSKRYTTGIIVPPIDTAEVLSELNVVEKQNNKALIHEEIEGLNDKIDTIELMYVSYACDCPNWVNPVEYQKAEDLKDRSDLQSDSALLVFNQKEFAYYIEPADEDLKINRKATYNRNIVRFTGRSYKEPGYPDKVEFTDPNPPKGKVFRYYSFEILKPYKVWGPHIFEGLDEISGDSLFDISVLTVR